MVKGKDLGPLLSEEFTIVPKGEWPLNLLFSKLSADSPHLLSLLWQKFTCTKVFYNQIKNHLFKQGKA